MGLNVLYLGGAALTVAIFHALVPRWWAACAGAFALVLMFVTGLAGYAQGTSRTDAAIESHSHDARTSAADLADMHERGYLEALRPLQFAGVLAAACAIPLLAGELRRRRRRRSAVIAA